MGPEGAVTVNDEKVNLPYTKTWRAKQSVSIIKAGETVSGFINTIFANSGSKFVLMCNETCVWEKLSVLD